MLRLRSFIFRCCGSAGQCFTRCRLLSAYLVVDDFSNFNLKIHYPPPYERLIWKYEKANADLIKRAIKDFDWENKLSLIDINDQVVLFNETIVNIISNFIPNETMTFDDRDPL